MSRSRKPTASAPTAEYLAAAHAIAEQLFRTEHREHSLTGTGGALLLADVLDGEGPAVSTTTAARWEAAVVSSLETDVASFTDGMLGSAWLLARRGGQAALLRSVDDAVLDALADPTWPGALGIDHGGLAGFALYGLARKTPRGRDIVARCVAHLERLATRQHRWLPGLAALPEHVRANVRLLNMEGAAAAIAVLAAAADRVPRARALARAGARTLVADLGAASNRGIGDWIPTDSLGLVHGTATWSIGGAGVCAALDAVARIGGRAELSAALWFGRGLAGVPPEASKTLDASLGGGTTGIAVVLDALANRTRDRAIRYAADYWFYRTLRCRGDGGIGGYRFFCNAWEPRTGVLDGAVGTALALLVAAGRPRARVCRTVLGVS